MMNRYQADERGYYGEFGGAFIPEMLYPNTEELRQNYLRIMEEPEFQEEFRHLLRDYVGRPTPLYFAKRLSEKFKARIYLKREDLCHTGAHKVNNTIGQILMAKTLGIAGLLVLVETTKELSATLLLRPFNFNTLATYVYERATRAVFEEAAFASLLIVAVGLVPVFILTRVVISEHRNGERKKMADLAGPPE